MDPNEVLQRGREALRRWHVAPDTDAALKAAEDAMTAFAELDAYVSHGGLLPSAWTEAAR